MKQSQFHADETSVKKITDDMSVDHHTQFVVSKKGRKMDLKTWQTRISITLVIFSSVLSPPVESTGEKQSSITRIQKKKKELEHPMDFRIVGGNDASIKDFPYIVSLQMNSNHICGGSILTESFILTAAHCIVDFDELNHSWRIPDPLDYNIVAGQTILDHGDCQFRDIKKIFVHSDYDHSILKNDIAILETINPLKWTNYTKPAKLFTKHHEPFETREFCTAIGWGSTEAETKSFIKTTKNLQEVDLKPSVSSACEKLLSEIPNLFDATKLCIIISEGKDACVGDSGGPLICDEVQYGITSFGLGCAQADMPGVFTNVSAFEEWIDSVLNETNLQVVSRKVEVVNLPRVLSILKEDMMRNTINARISSRVLIYSYFFIFVSIRMV